MKEATNRKTNIPYILTDEEYRQLVNLKMDKKYIIRDVPEKKLKNFELIKPEEIKPKVTKK